MALATEQRTNRLLTLLSDDDYERLRPHFSISKLDYRKVLYDARREIRNVYFPIDGVASLVLEMGNGGCGSRHDWQRGNGGNTDCSRRSARALDRIRAGSGSSAENGCPRISSRSLNAAPRFTLLCFAISTPCLIRWHNPPPVRTFTRLSSDAAAGC